MKLVVVLVLAITLLILVRRNYLQVDMSFPLFATLVILGFASMSRGFIDWIAGTLGIVDEARAIVLIAITILLAIVTILAVVYSRLRHRQTMLLRAIAAMELNQQEKQRTESFTGPYPLLDSTPLSSVVAVAGGITRNADLRNLELTRFSADNGAGTSPSVRQVINVVDQGFENVLVNPGDVIRFNREFTDRDAGPVLLSGEFVRPGLFDIRRGERLSEVIARAGGLTSQAYPYGAVFSRERVKRAQQAGFQRAQRELTSAATFAAAKRGVDPAAVIALQQITRELNSVEAVGRVVIESDPTVLQVKPGIRYGIRAWRQTIYAKVYRTRFLGHKFVSCGGPE